MKPTASALSRPTSDCSFSKATLRCSKEVINSFWALEFAGPSTRMSHHYFAIISFVIRDELRTLKLRISRSKRLSLRRRLLDGASG